MKSYRVGIKGLPFTLLLIDLIWFTLSFQGIHIQDFWFFGEIHGHSPVFVFLFAFYGLVHRFCAYTWVCLAGLTGLNALNIIHYFVDFEYPQTYAGIILITSLCFAVIYQIKNKKCTR